MIRVIEDFRRHHGIQHPPFWNGLVSYYCNQHSWAMARAGNIYHAPDYFLNGWREAVAMMSYTGEEGHELCAKIIWDVIGTSKPHTEVLLRSSELAYGLVLHNYKWYLTIRGK